MALSLFDSAFFPMSRVTRPSLGRMLAPRGTLFDNNLFEAMDGRHAFLKGMNHTSEDGKPGHTHSFSYSSSTFKSAGSEPVSRRTETFRGSDGQTFSRSVQSVGEKSVEEIIKGGETTRKLHNLEVGDLESFNQTFEQHSSHWPFSRSNQRHTTHTAPALKAAPTSAEAAPATPAAALPTALLDDLSKVKQAHK